MAKKKKQNYNHRKKVARDNGKKGGRAPQINSQRRDEIWSFICDYASREAVCPTFQEIMVGCGIKTKSVVNYHVQKLIKDKKLERVGRNRMRIAGSMLVLPTPSLQAA